MTAARYHRRGEMIAPQHTLYTIGRAVTNLQVVMYTLALGSFCNDSFTDHATALTLPVQRRAARLATTARVNESDCETNE